MVQIREMRPSDLAVIARINVDSFKVTQQGVVSDGFLAQLSYDKAEQRFARMLQIIERQSFIYVAEVEGNVVGYAMAGLGREQVPFYEGELYGIYILPEYLRLGIGRRLMSEVASRLERSGINSMFVWVFSKNERGRAFYESVGGHKIAEREVDLGSESVSETAYGWSTLSGFV